MRAVLFCNEMLGLGHLRRSLALAEALVAESGGTALVVTGSSGFAGLQPPAGVDLVKLPTAPVGPDSSWNLTDRTTPSELAIPELDVRDLRARLAAVIVEEACPDVVVVDNRPLGRNDELLQALEVLRARPGCVAALGLREVADPPERHGANWAPPAVATTLRLYDLVLVYGPPAPDDSRVQALRDGGLPIHHVGRVAPALPPSGATDLGAGYLLATSGGGVDGFALLDTVLAALELRPLEVPVVVVAGPMMGGDELARLEARGAGVGARVIAHRSDMGAVVAGARATITMGGYSTTAEVLSGGKPALVVPRAFPRAEQLVRATALAAAGLVTMVHPDDLDAATLRGAIDDLLRRPSRPAAELPGAATAAQVLAAAVRAHAPAPVPAGNR